MKKIIIIIFSAVLLAGGFSSCKKTSIRKMSNDWTVSSFESDSATTTANGIKRINSVYNGEKIKKTYTDTQGQETLEDGTVQELSYKINKDGTFTSVYNVTFVSNKTFGSSVMTTTNVITNTTSGTWNFLGKVDEFKKNERVVFNTLIEDEKSETTIAYPSTSLNPITFVNKKTYANGENSKLFLVVESKRKKLQLSREGDFSGTDFMRDMAGNIISTYKRKVVTSEKITLVQK